MGKKLYEVEFIRQDNGELQTHYVLTDGIERIEEEYADWESIKPLTPLEEL